MERLLTSERTRDDLGDPDAWLATIAEREACRIMRRELLIRLRATGAEELEVVAVPDPAVKRLEGYLVFESMIAPLTPADRYLIRLKYDEDLTLRAIANRLGILEGNAKVRLHRALRKHERELRDRG
jgi:RNA polymerase sigma factor (sigma-70 family)